MYSLQIFENLSKKEQEKLIIDFFNISKINPTILLDEIDYGFTNERTGETIEREYVDNNSHLYCKTIFNLDDFNKYNIVKFLQKTKEFEIIEKSLVDRAHLIIQTVLKKFKLVQYSVYQRGKFFQAEKFLLFCTEGNPVDCKTKSFDKYIDYRNYNAKIIFIGVSYYNTLFDILNDLELFEKFKEIWKLN
jgi:hypothetical protein